MKHAFPWLLLPVFWGTRNRTLRREKGDAARAALFAGIGVFVSAAIFAVVFWLTLQLLDYEELGDYLVRLGLGWLFLTFLSFLAFSAVVTSLSTFFLSEDLRLLLAAPVPRARLFYSRFARAAAQSGWMVAAFLLPVLLAIGLARCAGAGFYLTAVVTVLPFVLIPCALGAVVTLALVNVFPARRARDVLMLMGLLFAMALVLLLRFLRPERLLDVQSLPDVTAFFATLQSPVTPLLPSFWAGETLFTGLQGGNDWLHLGALWTTALAFTVGARAAFDRLYFDGWSKAQEARKARFTRLRALEPVSAWLPLAPPARSLLLKDVKVFLRDTTQWSQLLLLVALALVYVYNFRVLDLDRIPYMAGMVKNAYAFVNLAMAAFVLSAVAVRRRVRRGVRVLDHPQLPRDHACLPLVEVLDRPLPHPRHGAVLDRGLQPASRGWPLPAGPGRGRHRLHDVRPRGVGGGHGSPLPQVRGRESDPGGRLLWRGGLHGPGRALHPGHGRPARLARLDLPRASVPGGGGASRSTDRHGALLPGRHAAFGSDVLAPHVPRHPGPRGPGLTLGNTPLPLLRSKAR